VGGGLGVQGADADGSAGDSNDLLAHDGISIVSVLKFEGDAGQMIPPLARSTWPLIHAPSGPARNATALAMSSGWPSRSSGASFERCSMTSCGLPSRNRAVAVGPGATALTVMLRPRSSFDSTCVIASTLALVAA